jgi:uncharacterized protein (TIGR02328 family)
MRLWHKDLIAVLPREQLVAQWRECSAIAGAIQKNGTPNHILVNYVVDRLNSFVAYSYMVRQEMTRRGYRTMENVWTKIKSIVDTDIWKDLEKEDIFEKEHNFRYCVQCYYNLQEKYDRGGIKEEDWEKIHLRYLFITNQIILGEKEQWIKK